MSFPLCEHGNAQLSRLNEWMNAGVELMDSRECPKHTIPWGILRHEPRSSQALGKDNFTR